MAYFCNFLYGLQACLFLVVARAVSSSSSSSHIIISGDVLKDQRYAGRNILQEQIDCPLSFEFANYTILTSKCKGPDYPAKQCCAALADFACPYAKFINDPSSKCSSTMFTYIDQRAGYPRGLFASECREDLPCPADSPTSSPADASAAAAADDDDPLFVIPQSLIFVSSLLLLWTHFIQ